MKEKSNLLKTARLDFFMIQSWAGYTPAFFVHDQHLQPVLHIGKAHIRVIIQRQDLHIGIKLLQPLDNASAHHMVGQTAKGLQYDEIAAAAGGVM